MIATALAEEIAVALESFIRDRFEVAPDDPYFDRETDLWTEGYVDSQGIVEIIEFLQDRFRVAIPNELLFEPEFVRISGIGKLIARLANGAA
jgi:acyl carrier protein